MTNRAMPGMVTPATIGWNIVSSSCRPRKYHGAFDGFGVWFGLASCSSGAFTNTEKKNKNAVQASAATNSAASRCGQVCTLSTGLALTAWVEPDFTTVSRRWVWPPGPAARGTPAPDTGAATTELTFSATAVEVPAVVVVAAPPPPAAALAAR